MTRFNVAAIRAQVRALDYVRGTPAEVAMWHEDDADARTNLAIEDMALTPDEDALFDMLRDEGVPLPSPPRPSSSCSIIPTRTRRWQSHRSEGLTWNGCASSAARSAISPA